MRKIGIYLKMKDAVLSLIVELKYNKNNAASIRWAVEPSFRQLGVRYVCSHKKA